MAESNLWMASSANPVTDARPMLRSARADPRVGHRLRLIPQRRSQPALDERQGHVLARVIVDDLIASDAADREVLRLRMGEVEAAHGCRGGHGEILGQLDAGATGLEQCEECRLLAVVG